MMLKHEMKYVAVLYSPYKYCATNNLDTIPDEFSPDIPRQSLSPGPILDWHEESNYGGY